MAPRKYSNKRSSLKKSLRKTISKSPKYVLVVLHTKPQENSGDEDEKTSIDYISLSLDILIFGFLAAVGNFYYVDGKENRDNSCAFEVPLFLMVTGYANILLSIIRFGLPVLGTFVQCFFNMVVAGFGGYIMFSNYRQWNGKDSSQENYCHPLPFLTAFVFTLVTVLWYGIIVLVVATVFCVAICRNSTDNMAGDLEDMRVTDKVFVMTQSQYRRVLGNVRRETRRINFMGKKKGSSKEGKDSVV